MRVSLLAALLFTASCGPNPPAPVRVMAIIPTETGSYETREVSLQTIGNITTLKGSVAEFVGENRVVVDPNDPLQRGGIENLSDEQRYEVLVKGKGGDVQDLLAAQRPEQKPDELLKMKVMYWPELRINSDTPITDNTLYLSFIKAFTVTPFQNEQKVPLGMNLGVIGHEVAHKVWGKRVFNDEGVHPALRWTQQPFNLLKSLDEGLADFHGYGTSCKSAANCRGDFLSISIADDKYARQRDVSTPDACLTAELRTALNTFSPDQWVRGRELYLYGNLWAATLYQAGSKVGGATKVQALRVDLLSAYSDDSSARPGFNQLINRNINNQMAFTPEAVAEIIAAHITDLDLKRSFCSEAIARLQLQCARTDCQDKMPSCPGTTRRATTPCKVLDPP